MLKTIGDVLELIAKTVGEYLWKKFLRFPRMVAESVSLARAVTLAGFILLSAGFISFAVHVARVQEEVRLTEEYARDASQSVELLYARASAVAELAKDLLRRQEISSQNVSQNLQVDTLLRLSEADGLAVIVAGRVRLLRGSLDSTVTFPGWNGQRWSEISLKITRSLQGKSETLVFLGLERLYRNREYLEKGGLFSGSLALAKAWRDHQVGWVAVVVLLPVNSLSPLLHLTQEEYVSGNYDYIVDCEGNLLIHPRPYVVSGTGIDARPVRAASNESEIGKLPINTRDADWIAGGDMLSKAFNAMVRGVPQSVVYKNLQRENRLTSFRRIDLKKHNIDGCLGVVAGRGLSPMKAATTPLLLKSPASLNIVLNAVLSVYVSLLGMWVALVIKIRSLQDDLVAWGRYATPSVVDGLDLIPIKNEPAEPRVYPDMVGVIITFNVPSFEKRGLGDLFDEFGGIAAKLREDGWIVSHWSLHSLFACRALKEKSEKYGRVWTPSQSVDYFRQTRVLAEEEGLSSTLLGTGKMNPADFRIVYGIGELRVHAFRTGSIRQAVISFYGDCLTDALYLEEILSDSDVDAWGGLFYSSAEVETQGFTLFGEESTCRGVVFRKIALGSA
jgi:hypothetical protein